MNKRRLHQSEGACSRDCDGENTTERSPLVNDVCHFLNVNSALISLQNKTKPSSTLKRKQIPALAFLVGEVKEFS